MFWSGNYIVVRELKCLLKEENVTLTQVLEADDILQECKADNKALIQFLTRPDILAELITLITEEPPKNVELASQYKHANIASEVLTSNLSMLRDRLSMDAVQMNRLCDFVSKEPPLNPLLASYFSKTVEMLLERSPKQDWYLHHIVCLHVLDVFKSRRDFLPNLLRHLSTSAISDTFKCFLHLGSPFNKIILEWLDEHQFLESLIQIICGTYDPEEALFASVNSQQAEGEPHNQHDRLDSNHNAEGDHPQPQNEVNSRTQVTNTNGEAEPEAGAGTGAPGGDEAAAERAARAERIRGVAAANAAALLCDIACDASSVDPFNNEWYAGRTIAARLRGEEAVRRLLQGVFTSPPRARHHALVNACRLLLALLSTPLAPPNPQQESAEAGEESCAEHGAVERAIAPHLPLLHHALLHDAPRRPNTNAECVREGGERDEIGEVMGEKVGAARVSVAALLARLALSEVDDVPTALISLGTAGVLVDMLFQFPNNNFLHAQVCALVRNARANRRFSHRYTAHLIEECNLLTRLMDAFEENEEKKEGGVRAGYMGHVVAALRSLDAASPVLSSALQQRWDAFRETKLRPLLHIHDTPLGGIYPSENNMYEAGSNMAHMDSMADVMGPGYDYTESAASFDEGAEACEPLAEPLDESRDDQMERMQETNSSYFLELVNSRRSEFDDDLWDDAEPTPLVLQHDSPWEGAGGGCGAGGGEEGWAQFDAFADTAPPPDPFAPIAPMLQGLSFWSPAESQEQNDLEGGSQDGKGCVFEDGDKDALTILLAQKMLTAFHSMPPEDSDADFQLPHSEEQASGSPGQPAAQATDPRADALDTSPDEPTPLTADPQTDDRETNRVERMPQASDPPVDALETNPVEPVPLTSSPRTDGIESVSDKQVPQCSDVQADARPVLESNSNLPRESSNVRNPLSNVADDTPAIQDPVVSDVIQSQSSEISEPQTSQSSSAASDSSGPSPPSDR